MNNQPNLIKLITEIPAPASVGLDDTLAIAAGFAIAAIVCINAYAFSYLYAKIRSNTINTNTTNTNNPVDPEIGANDQTNDIPLQDLNTAPEPPVNPTEVLNQTNFTTNTLESREQTAQRAWEAFQEYFM
jgi:hypothetical protein